MAQDKSLEKIGDIIKNRVKKTPLPAYAWQELALKVIKELSIPNYKRSAVFLAAKQKPRIFIEKCLSDTKELCQSGEKWKYFFKLVNNI